MEYKIKDLQNFVKDSKTGAVILKREKSPIDVKLENLTNNYNNSLSLLSQKIDNLQKDIIIVMNKLDKLLDNKNND